MSATISEADGAKRRRTAAPEADSTPLWHWPCWKWRRGARRRRQARGRQGPGPGCRRRGVTIIAERVGKGETAAECAVAHKIAAQARFAVQPMAAPWSGVLGRLQRLVRAVC